MPYIYSDFRVRFAAIKDVPAADSAGELNYLITCLTTLYIYHHGLNYGHLNDVVGVLECAKREFQRRFVDAYEALKLRENGDVL